MSQMIKHQLSKREMIGFAGWMFVVFVAASLGAVASIDASGFYSQLTRPEWAPPASVFGPVWTVLYVLMGISAWLVWRVKNFRIFHPRAYFIFCSTCTECPMELAFL